MEMALLDNRSAIEAWQRGLVNAARPISAGEDISCIGDTARLNQLETYMPHVSRPMSVLVDARECRSQSSAWTCRVWSRPFPPDAVRVLDMRGVGICMPWFCFLRMAAKLDLPDAVRLGMELCGTYSTLPFAQSIEPTFALSEREMENGFVECRPICTAAELRHAISQVDAAGRTKAAKAARYVVDNARSPGESRLYLLLCLPARMGGYGLPRPQLNVGIDLPDDIRRITRMRKYICDMYFPEQRLAIEYDGAYHGDRSQRMDDNLRELLLHALGVEVLRVDKLLLENPTAFDLQVSRIAQRIGVRLRAPTAHVRMKREALRKRVLDWDVDLYA